MNMRASVKNAKKAKAVLVKRDPGAPAFKIEKGVVVVKAGTVFNGVTVRKDSPALPPEGGFVAGVDYGVFLSPSRAPRIKEISSHKLVASLLGGFHFAPGGNAKGTEGGDGTPAINPNSMWDRNFRPACRDPRGMTFVALSGGKQFWCDIYLLGKDHLTHSTSKLGVTIADGNDAPENHPGVYFSKFDFANAKAALAQHGKQLLGAEEFFAAAYGVKERSSADGDPKVTKLDPPRTSRAGVMQATGNLWVWGTDGHPDDPRPSIFGGSWMGRSNAGSRCATLDYWPEVSSVSLGARGRSDHLSEVLRITSGSALCAASVGDARAARVRSRSARSSTFKRWSARRSCFGEYIARSGIAGRRARECASRPAPGIGAPERTP